MRRSILGAIIIFAIGTTLTSTSEAFTDSEAVHAIMGEARGESYNGKLAVAEAIRRRDTLSGVYGASVPLGRLKTEQKRVWDDALRAWQDSRMSNLVPGCKYWFSDADLRKLNARHPKWFKKLKFVKKIGGSSFYAEHKV